MDYILTHISGTKDTSGDNELIPAPGAGKRIVVTSFVIQNESSSATTMILKDGSSNKWRFLGQNQGDYLSKDFGLKQEWRLTANQALNLNLSGNNQCGYSIAYFIEVV